MDTRTRPHERFGDVMGVSFARDLRVHGSRAALVDPDGAVVSYAELADRVDDARDRLGSTRRLVLIEGANRLEPVIVHLAALAGGHPILLVPGTDRALTESLIDRYDPDVTLRGTGGEAELTPRRGGTAHDLHPELSLLLSTSGSTGSPKLVRLSRRNVESNAAAIAGYLGIDASDRAITSLPLHYCYGLSVLHTHLSRGAAVALTETSVVDPCFWSRFHEVGATGLAGVPYTFDLLDRVGFSSMHLPTLRYVTQAGGRLAPEKVRNQVDLAARRGWRFYVMYGQTEATARMAYVPPDLVADHPGAIGVPIDGGSFRIDPVPGEPHGELVYRGPNVMLGYAHAPADLALGRTVDELRTGDLARRGPGGLYEVVGRTSRFIKPFGVRVDLDAVEQLLREHDLPAVCTGDDEHLVIALERARGRAGDAPAVGGEAVSGAADDQTSARALELVQTRLGLPRGSVRVRWFDTLPRLANGKPDHPAIRNAATEGHEDRSAAPAFGEPKGAERDRSVRRIFAEVLSVRGIADDDTFVGLGGDSLSYVEASLSLEQELGFVPDGWHLCPVGELDRLHRPRPASWRRHLRTMETNVALRAAAIVLVVCTHSGVFHQQGGAHLLFALAGFNFARFQLGGDERSETRRRLTSITRVAVPTLAFTALAMVVRDGFALSNVLLVNNYVGDGRWWYWYVEALLQVLVVLTAVFAVPAARRLERRWPFAVPIAALAPLLAVRFGALGSAELAKPLIAAHVIGWLFVVGWAAQRASTGSRRALVSALVLLAMPGFFDNTSRELIVAGAVLAAMWVPRVSIPAVLHRATGTLASASLYIYLTHFFVYSELRDSRGPLVAASTSLLLGIGTWLVVERGRRLAVDRVPLPRGLRSSRLVRSWRWS